MRESENWSMLADRGALGDTGQITEEGQVFCPKCGREFEAIQIGSVIYVTCHNEFVEETMEG
jgi:uncharacterized Zn finger protein (UPF0148 family)